MYQVPIEVLNQIKPRSQWGKRFLTMNQEQMDRAMERQANAMEALGYDNKVILAYQSVLFLILERDAITKMIQAVGRSDLRMMLPEVLNREEAVSLMQREYRLTKKQADSLHKALPSQPLTSHAAKLLGTWPAETSKTAS